MTPLTCNDAKAYVEETLDRAIARLYLAFDVGAEPEIDAADHLVDATLAEVKQSLSHLTARGASEDARWLAAQLKTFERDRAGVYRLFADEPVEASDDTRIH